MTTVASASDVPDEVTVYDPVTVEPSTGFAGVTVGVGGVIGVAVGGPPGVGVGGGVQTAPPVVGVGLPGKVVGAGVGVGVSLATGALVGARPLCVVGGALTVVVPLVVAPLVVLLVVGVWVGAGALVVGVTVTL